MNCGAFAFSGFLFWHLRSFRATVSWWSQLLQNHTTAVEFRAFVAFSKATQLFFGAPLAPFCFVRSISGFLPSCFWPRNNLHIAHQSSN